MLNATECWHCLQRMRIQPIRNSFLPMRARSMTFSRVAYNGKGWWTYTNAVVLSSRTHDFHPNSSYTTTKLYETLACGCNNNTIFQNELFSRFLPSTYVAWQRRSLGDGAKVARWRHWWIRHFSCLNLLLRVTTVSNIMIIL